MASENKRMAVLAGCNYANTSNQLHGCINDVLAMSKLIIGKFGFDPSHVHVLTDETESQIKPTAANIKRAINTMIDQAEPGDVLFFHFSGHGTWYPYKHHHKMEEAIVPCDLNLITDVDFRQMVNQLPKDVTFTILSDSCHSGGLIDKEREQVGPGFTPPPPASNLLHHHGH